MKIRILLFSFVSLMINSFYAQIPNSGFENWTNPNGYNVPDSWGNLNPVTYSASVFTCIKGAPGSPGSAYLRLVSKTVPGMGVQPGIAVSGVLNTTTFQPAAGFAFTDRPASMKGKWQFMANGADQGYIALYLTKWNTGANRRDTVGMIMNLLQGMVMSWQSFTLPISYNSLELPDTAVIIFSASGKIPVDGSYLYIDNLSFFGSASGWKEQSDQTGLTIFPNPVIQNEMLIDFKNREFRANMITVLDLHGKVVLRKEVDKLPFPVTLDVSALNAGSYLLRISTPYGSAGSKFIKQ